MEGDIGSVFDDEPAEVKLAEVKPTEGEEQKDVVMESEEALEEQPKGKPISGLVNQEFVTMIQEMGYTKAVAEKSLLYTNNKSVEGAMEWINQHQDDPDFLDEEFIADESTRDPNKPQLSKEEKLKAAKELQERLRIKRAAEEKRLEEEREKERIRSTKELQKAQKKMEEQQMQLHLELERKEKLQFKKDKKKMEELLKKEAAERAGRVYVPGEDDKVVKHKPSVQEVKEGVKIVLTLYTEDRRPGVAKTCFKTFHTFCKNVLKDPKDVKFRTINLSNEKVQSRIAKISGGLKMLKGVGFQENDEGNLELNEDDVDLDLIKEAIEYVEMKF